MIIQTYYVYPLVHAGEVSVGGVVGAIILGTIIFGIVVAITIAVALVIALRQKAKQCGSVDIKPTVSVNIYNLWILVYCTVKFYPVWRWFIVIHRLNCCLKLV